jgi:hypothetical protein
MGQGSGRITANYGSVRMWATPRNRYASVAPPTTTIPTPPPATKLKVGNSTNGAKRPTLLASTLPPSKPQAPVTKAASFTG